MAALEKLVNHELNDVYNSSEHLLDVLQRMKSDATNSEIVEMLETYYDQAQYQKKKLEEHFSERPNKKEETDCLIMEALKKHGLESIRYQGSTEIRDIVLLLTVNMMKHFENTAFGTLIAQAKRLKDEELVDLLNSLKKKIAEERKRPLDIADAILKEGKSEDLKKEVETLLTQIIQVQVKDEKTLLDFLEHVIQEANSSELQDAIETYISEHAAYLEKFEAFLAAGESEEEVKNWETLHSFVSEWKEHLGSIPPGDLKDIGILLSIQRIMHQNAAVYEIEGVLADFLESRDMLKSFETFHQQEMDNDQSFTAIAEGSLFQKGLDAKVS